jgi:hypothetical protein
LKEIKGGDLRQGSAGYNLDRVEKYIESGGEHIDFARKLRNAITNNNVDSFASFNRSDRLIKFDLSQYTGTANFNLRPETYTVVSRK